MCREFYFNDPEMLKLSENYVKILNNSIAWWEEILMENNSNIETLLKRVDIFLEDGNWVAANEYCEKILDIDPENADAYLGKLMTELNVHNREALKDCKFTLMFVYFQLQKG